jgi:hypothetical protein
MILIRCCLMAWSFMLGESCRKTPGGFWVVHLAEFEPDYKYGESAVIEGFMPTKDDAAFCPGFPMMEAIQDRIGKMLGQNLNAFVDYIADHSQQWLAISSVPMPVQLTSAINARLEHDMGQIESDWG